MFLARLKTVDLHRARIAKKPPLLNNETRDPSDYPDVSSGLLLPIGIAGFDDDFDFSVFVTNDELNSFVEFPLGVTRVEGSLLLQTGHRSVLSNRSK